MRQWEEKGFCIRSQDKLHCCNPMLVMAKRDLQTGELKKRPCMDFSRHVNKFTKDQPVKISNLQEAEKLLELNDFMRYFDLENMYMQLKLDKEYWKYQGCAIEDSNGETIYFVFTV